MDDGVDPAICNVFNVCRAHCNVVCVCMYSFVGMDVCMCLYVRNGMECKYVYIDILDLM